MAKPALEHRHYVLIAKSISELPPDIRGVVANRFANDLRGTNPNYSHARFMAAANGEPINWRDK